MRKKRQAANPRGRAPLPAVEAAKKRAGWLSIAGAAHRGKVSTHMVRRWAARGLIGSQQDGTNVWVFTKDLDTMIRQRNGKE